jgi:glycosyltransferase involved in cell wall biosynthesis
MKISVVIATFNRKDSLQSTLNAIFAQDYPVSQFEVIVINDGSTDGTDNMIDGLEKPTGLTFQYFTQANKGPAAARNVGLKSAQGDLIAFTDDDCLPHRDWLKTIARELATEEIVGLQGKTYSDAGMITPLTHQIENLSGTNDVPTCNAAYRRSVLMAVGGFDDKFPFPHNEDADLAWRIMKIGEIRFCPEMIVHHPPREDRFKKVMKRMRILESEFRLFHKDPDSYRKYRAPSQWNNIYWQVGTKTQWYYFKNRFRFLSKPRLFVTGLLLTAIWSFQLIWFFPRFLRVDKINRRLFAAS